jgi:hypothetical protein
MLLVILGAFVVFVIAENRLSVYTALASAPASPTGATASPADL